MVICVCDFPFHSNKLFKGNLVKLKIKTGAPRMSFSRVTEEQTLEISRDGSVRFEKSNILDTEETRELLSPDATANIFTAFKDFFTILHLWVITNHLDFPSLCLAKHT